MSGGRRWLGLVAVLAADAGVTSEYQQKTVEMPLDADVYNAPQQVHQEGIDG
uniref:Uncharacterized protein n=1 Tax=Setaria viridis TaxID=4556 RepID=A0A4U6SU44_SETVI|nr:hypothetical protein SEVIR_9G125432v2 [Setaria viridis]